MVYAQDYFEGKVTYDISYEPIHPNATVEFLEENYGVKEILYYKKGHYKKIRLIDARGRQKKYKRKDVSKFLFIALKKIQHMELIFQLEIL